MRLLTRAVVLAFAVIQLILVGRILLDLGIIPAEGLALDYLVPWSDALAAPVEGLARSLGGGGLGGFGGFGGGGGLHPVMLGALAAWTIVEGLVIGVVRKLASG